MYKLYKGQYGEIAAIIKTTNDSFIPFDPDNTDFVEYQKWLDAGNTPLPADEVKALVG